MYDNSNHVEKTFDRESMPDILSTAQKNEFLYLVNILRDSECLLDVLDIGVGDARIIQWLVENERDIWDSKIKEYTGIDVADSCVDMSKEYIKNKDLKNVTILNKNAENLSEINGLYDLIICTRFTAGNFYPNTYDPKKHVPGSLNLENNIKFTNIFMQAYNKLAEGGELILGSVYINNDRTRLKQESAYRDFGREIITDNKDSFTATKDGRRSQRFTKERIYKYLPDIKRSSIKFVNLDPDDFAMMVRIKKE